MRRWQWAYREKKSLPPPSVLTLQSVGDHKQEQCTVQTIIQVWTGLDQSPVNFSFDGFYKRSVLREWVHVKHKALPGAKASHEALLVIYMNHIWPVA